MENLRQNAMKNISSLEALNQVIQSEEGVLILFGGQNCQVCHAIKPNLIAMVAQAYPKLKMVYVDCHVSTDVCAQKGVLSLPTLQVYFTGQKFIEEVRTFSLQKVIDEIRRPYGMCFEDEY